MNLCEKADNMKSCDKFQLEERDDEIVMCEHCLVRDGKYYCEQYIITKTWLPVFPGFYGTSFDADSAYGYEEESIREHIKPEELADCMIENLYRSEAGDKFFREYQESVARQSTELIESELKNLGLVESVEFEQVVSPKEYNFVNDAIDVTFTITPENLLKIKKFIAENFKQWKIYLKERYTSYDGFISFHSTDPGDEEWLIENAIRDSHNAGSLLEFICFENGITSDVLLDHYYDEVSLDDAALKKECIQNGWYTPPNFCLDWIKAVYYKIRNRNILRIKRIRFPQGVFQLKIVTLKNTYFFAVTKEKIHNESNFHFKRIFKIFIFARLKNGKKQKDS